MRASRVVAAAAATVLGVGLGGGLGAAASAAVVPDPAGRACHNGLNGFELPVTWTGLDHAEVVRGGAPVETTVSVHDTSGRDVRNLNHLLLLESSDAITTDRVSVEMQLPGGGWKPAPPTSQHLSIRVEVGPQNLASDATLTVRLRITFSAVAPVGDHYRFSWTGNSDLLDDDTGAFVTVGEVESTPAVPGGKGTCTMFGSVAHAGFAVVDAPAPSTSPTASPAVSPSASPSASPTVSPTATASAPAVPTATPSPGATRSAAAGSPAAYTGSRLADTGGGGAARPLALTGAAAVLLGGGVLVALRRRTGPDS